MVMQKEWAKRLKKVKAWQLFIGMIVVVIVIVAFNTLIPPERSVVAYCKTWKEQETKLSHAYGDTYSTTVFSHSSNNPHDFAVALGKMDRVAPKEIEPDVKGLEAVFAKIDKDPSQAISASLSGIEPESSVTDWTNSHCTSKGTN